MALCLTGCGGQTPPSGTGSNHENAVLTQSADDNNSEGNLDESSGEAKISDEILNAELFSDQIQVGNTVLTLPISYTDLISAGAILASTDVSESYLMDATSCKLEKNMIISGGGTLSEVFFDNISTSRTELKNATTRMFTSESENVIFPKGIHVGSTLTELTELWGEPTDDTNTTEAGLHDQLTYTYLQYPIRERYSDIISASGRRYTVTIDRNTSTIQKIACYTAGKFEEGKTITQELDGKFLGDEKSRLSWEIPAEATRPWVTSIPVSGGMVVEADGNPYAINMNLQWKADSCEFWQLEVSEAGFNEFCNRYSSGNEVEVISIAGKEATVLSYSSSEDAFNCSVMYTNDGTLYTAGGKIIPVDENGTITDAAKAKFKEIMTDFAKSVKKIS